MCGILAFITDNANKYKDVFDFALNEMNHRGPDGQGKWSSKKALIGHNRLSIIDLSASGNQPMIFENRYVLSFNGEIYNYKSIKTELIKKGFQFRGGSDSEVLLYSYVAWGEAALNRLNGMFAFAIWDEKEQILFAARDRLGQKPLFYYHQNGVFGISSEMKGLYPLLSKVEPNIDTLGIIQKSSENFGDSGYFKYEATDKSLVRGINRLKAGHFIKYKNCNLFVNKYWDVRENLIDIPNSFQGQTDLFHEIFEDSIKLRLQSDVPVATALSGGLDSSSIVGIVNKLRNSNFGANSDYKVFIARMEGVPNIEEKSAKEVIERLDLNYEFLDIDPLEDIENLDQILYKFEELYLSNPIPLINTYKAMATQGFKVSLDGHGADELFGGYVSDLYASVVDSAPNYIAIKNKLNSIKAIEGKEEKLVNVFNYYKHALKNKYFISNDSKDPLFFSKEEKFDYLNSSLLRNTESSGLPTLLRNYDRYSMISGVEVRCPFIDHRLVSLAFSLPSSAKFRNGFSKAIIRNAVRDFVPFNVVYRKQKLGFHPPMGLWLKTHLKEWFLDEVNSKGFADSRFLEYKNYRKQVELFYSKEEMGSHVGAKLWEDFLIYLWEKSLKIANQKISNLK